MKEYIERAALKRELAPYEENDFSQQMDVILAIVDAQPTANVVEVRHAKWKYFHKQNKAVCTSCSFERDLDTDFGRAIACPNCGARMDKEDEHEAG